MALYKGAAILILGEFLKRDAQAKAPYNAQPSRFGRNKLPRPRSLSYLGFPTPALRSTCQTGARRTL